MNKIANENYYIVYYWMTGELGLTGITREVYAVLFAFYKNGLAFNGSVSYLAKFIGVSRQTIFKSLNSLVEKELILKQSETVNNIKNVTYQINLLPLKKIDGGSQNILSGQSNFLSGGGQNSLPNNTINNTSITTTIITNVLGFIVLKSCFFTCNSFTFFPSLFACFLFNSLPIIFTSLLIFIQSF